MSRSEARADFDLNLSRVRSLVRVYSDLAGHGQGRRPVGSTDLLRAAVVLLHAALEDVLRGLQSDQLPKAEKDILDRVPLVGLGDRHQKFFLGELAGHRAKTVSQLIAESVDCHLAKRSYNSIVDIERALQSIDVDPDIVRGSFPVLEEMIRRRHHIVHQADRQDAVGSGHHRTKSIDRATVEKWISQVDRFVATVLSQV